MVLVGHLGRLCVAQGVAGLVLAVFAHGQDRPAAVWVLAFLGSVLLSTGCLLWQLGDGAAEKARQQQATEAVLRATTPADRGTQSQ